MTHLPRSIAVRETHSTPRLLVIRGLSFYPAPTFPIGSPGQEDDILRLEAAVLLSSLQPLGSSQVECTPVAIQLLRFLCESQYTSSLLAKQHGDCFGNRRLAVTV